MKLIKSVFVTLGLVAALGSGCAYAGVAAAGNSVVVARNDAFLLGALRKVFVCQVSPAGLTGCAAGEAP